MLPIFLFHIFRNKPRALTGNEVLSLHTDLLQYKRKRDSSFDDSDTEDDAISLGASTSGVSGAGKIKSAEFESEMNRIREVNIVFVWRQFLFRT